MKIGIDSYSYHRLFGEVYGAQEVPKQLKTVEDFLGMAKNLGVEGVSLETCFLPSLEEQYLKDLGDSIADYGFESVFAWGHPAGLERGLNTKAFEEMKSMIPKTKLIGADIMRIVGSSFTWYREDHKEHLERLIPMYVEATKIAEDNGVKLAVENHSDYTIDEMLTILEAVDSPSFGINFDTGNCVRLLDDPVAGMEKLAPYVLSTHIKDVTLHPSAKPTDWYYFCGVPVGFGIVEMEKIIEILCKRDYQGMLAIEIDFPAPKWTNFEDEMIAISVANLKKMVAKCKGVVREKEGM